MRVLLSIAPETSLMASDEWDHVDIRSLFSWKAFVWSPMHIEVIAIMFDIIYTLVQRCEGSVKKGATRQCASPAGKRAPPAPTVSLPTYVPLSPKPCFRRALLEFISSTVDTHNAQVLVPSAF